MNRRTSLVTIAALLALSAGCAASVRVVNQAAPNPFIGQQKYTAGPVDWGKLAIAGQPENDYLSGKSPEVRQSLKQDKATLNTAFLDGLVSTARELGLEVTQSKTAPTGPLAIHAYVTWMEVGAYSNGMQTPSKVTMNVKITGPDGKATDEISLTSETSGSERDASSGQRLSKDGKEIGASLARYLRDRATP